MTIPSSDDASTIQTPPASDFDKISSTALLVAYARQFSDIPYTKEVAELTDAVATVKQFVSVGQKQPVVVAALIEARYLKRSGN